MGTKGKDTPQGKALAKFEQNQINEGAFNLGSAVASNTKSTNSALAQGERRLTRSDASQQNLIQDLQTQAAGQGPSLAEAQLKAASDRNLAQQVAAAASGRGGNQAAIQRQLARQQQASGQQVAQDAAQARIQEQVAARNQLGSAIAQQQNAGLTQTSDARQQRLSGQIAGAQSSQALEQLKLQRAGQAAQLQAAVPADKSWLQGALGTLGDVATFGATAFSDKKLKKDIKDGDKSTAEFLDAISAKTFKFKDGKQALPGAEKGGKEQLGILAQDLEKSKLGKNMVQDTDMGKMIDMAQGFGAVLAAQANLNKRLSEIEKKRKGQK